MSAEFSELVNFKKEFDKACDERDKDIEDAVLEMADYLIATVTPLTPVYAPKSIDGHTYEAYDNGGKRTGGELRKHWQEDNKNLKVRHVGNDYVVTVISRMSDSISQFILMGNCKIQSTKRLMFQDNTSCGKQRHSLNASRTVYSTSIYQSEV